jgi:hypothetical protein
VGSAYARRREQIDRILSCFVLGLSVRKVSAALLPILGRPISPATVSTVAKQLEAVVTAFTQVPLKDRYRVLMLDGIVLAVPAPAPSDGQCWLPSAAATARRKEVIDAKALRMGASPGDLIRRWLTGDRLEISASTAARDCSPTDREYDVFKLQRRW